MDLIFTKSETGKSWVAEFEATADFNLHIERLEKGGDIWLYQRTNGGGWDIVNDFANPRYGVIDYDCAALIYPKFIKVVSEVEPTYAAVTSAGEVTEIKSQDKSVEVTSNGTIEVTPDAGFAYLNSVKVKTNVATSGEGEGSGSSMRYIKVTSDDSIWLNMFMYATLVAAEFKDGGSGIIPPAMTSTPVFTIKMGKGLAFCWDAKMVAQGQTITLGESMEALFVQFGFQPDYITEEEFYTL